MVKQKKYLSSEAETLSLKNNIEIHSSDRNTQND